MGYSPEQLSLGHLAIKLAQAAPVSAQYAEQGRSQTVDHQQGYQTGTAGTTSGAEMLGGLGDAVFGEGAGGLVQALAMFAQPHLAAKGVDITQRIEQQYGGNAQDAREAQAVMNELRQPSILAAAASVDRLGGALDGLFNKMSGGKWATLAPGGVASMLAAFPPQAKGNIVSQIAMQVPEFRDLMSRLDPKLVLDYTPLVNATYMRNGGRFNAQDFRQLHQVFSQMADQNQLGAVPAQVAIEAVPFAIKRIGPQATAQQIASLSQMAYSAHQRGLAPTYGTAMDLLDSFGGLGEAAKNPKGTMQFLDQVENGMRSAGLSRAQVFQMAQMAKEKGLPVRTMMEAQLGAAEAAKAFRGTPDEAHVQNAALESFANIGNSDSLKALTVLSERDPRWSRAINGAIAKGDSRQLNRIATQAMRNPRNWKLMQTADTGRMAAALSQTPGMAGKFMMGEFQRFAKHTNNRQLQQLLARPDELERRIVNRDYSGLNSRTVDALSAKGRFNGRLGAAFMVARAQGRRPTGPKTPAVEPLTRFGVQYGKAAPVPAAPAGSKPLPTFVPAKPAVPAAPPATVTPPPVPGVA